MSSSYQTRWMQLADRLINDLVRNPDVALPGMLELGRKYNVSRHTVERAVGHLEDLGIVAPAQHGKKRQINHFKLRDISFQTGREERQLRTFHCQRAPW